MTSLSGCERAVVETLISIFKKLSNCQASSSESEVIVVEKVLQNLLALNETMGNDVDIMSPEEIFFRESIDPQNVSGLPTVIGPTFSLPENNYGQPNNDGPTGTKKMHQLEIIKVFVLIFVISIILLTTCRMVFQLFIRFRPEKPPIA